MVGEDRLDLFEAVVGGLSDVWLDDSWPGFVGCSTESSSKNLAVFLLTGDRLTGSVVLGDCPDVVVLVDWLVVAFFGPDFLSVPLVGGVWFAI